MSGKAAAPAAPVSAPAAVGTERLREGDLTKVTQLGLGTVLLGLGSRSLTPLGHHIIWHGCVILGMSQPGPEPQLLRSRAGSGLVGRSTAGISRAGNSPGRLERGSPGRERSDCHLDLIEKQPLSWLWGWRHQTLAFVNVRGLACAQLPPDFPVGQGSR